MDRLEEIKNEIAKELGCADYETLINEEGDDLINTLLNLSAKRYAKECIAASLKQASESAKIDVKGMLTRNVCTETVLHERTGIGSFAERSVKIHVESIISGSNFILV